jgi:tetratricopeptide (TPR) repeat protein
MQARAEAMSEAMEEFVEQDELMTMVLNVSDDDMLYPIKALEGLDRASQVDVFLSFGHAFQDASSWMDQAASLLAQQVEGGNELKAQKRRAIAEGTERPNRDPTLTVDLEPWPEPPPELMDSRRAAWKRLAAMIEYADRLIPADGEHRVVWGLLPITIADPRGYLDLVARLITEQELPACVARHRFFIRDNRLSPFMVPLLEAQKVMNVLVLDLDFSPERLHDDLVQEVGDPAVPDVQRVLGVLQLAAVDFAYKRDADAHEKYAAVYEYFDGKDQPAVQSLCLAGVGDIAARQDDHQTALARYRQALALVAPIQQPSLMLLPMLGAGRAAYKLGDFAEAEAYLGNAADLAGKGMNYTMRCDALYEKGLAQRQAGKFSDAIESWRAGKTLAATFEYHDGHRKHLEAMIELYQHAGMRAEEQECRTELMLVGRGA